MLELSEFLAGAAERPFAWGQEDCALWLADWWAARRGSDPAAGIRGTYHDEASCHRLVRQAGGLVRLVSGIAEQAGAVRVKAPETGDVAVLKVGRMQVCGIRSGAFWAVRNEQVGFLSNGRVLRAWRV